MRRVDVLGVTVTAVPLSAAADEFHRWIERDARAYICFANVHLVETAAKLPAVAAAVAGAGMVLADGAPVAMAVRLLTGTSTPRVAGSDFFEEICRRSADAGYRHFLLGSTPYTLRRLEARLCERHPGIAIVGSHSPPFRQITAMEERDLVAAINARRPDVVWVGLGAPKQELWMHQFRNRLDAPVIAGIGAVFDFASGMKPRAPGRLQRAGLEWLHRLLHEPRRLARRYAITNGSFVIRLAAELVTRRGQA